MDGDESSEWSEEFAFLGQTSNGFIYRVCHSFLEKALQNYTIGEEIF